MNNKRISFLKRKSSYSIKVPEGYSIVRRLNAAVHSKIYETFIIAVSLIACFYILIRNKLFESISDTFSFWLFGISSIKTGSIMEKIIVSVIVVIGFVGISVIIMIAVHELTHIAAIMLNKKAALRNKNNHAIKIRVGYLFSIYYIGIQTRNEYLFTYIAPLLLSVLFITFPLMLFNQIDIGIVVLLFNTALSAYDIVGFMTILKTTQKIDYITYGYVLKKQ